MEDLCIYKDMAYLLVKRSNKEEDKSFKGFVSLFT